MTDETRFDPVSNRTSKAVSYLFELPGDDIACLLFLGSLLLFGSIVRIESPDGTLAAVGDTLIAVDNGQLYLDTLRYTGENSRSPGIQIIRGRRYGRGYAQAVAALPILFIFRILNNVVNPLIVVAGGWSLSMVAFASRLDRLVGLDGKATQIGTIVAAALFAINAIIATPIDSQLLPVLALGVSTALTGAAIPTVIYIWVRQLYGKIVGMAAGVAVIVASPVAFWAAVPRYHTLIALLVAGSITAFYLGKHEHDSIRWRVLAYVAAGLATWVHPLEGGLFLGIFILIDIATAGRTTYREHIVIATAFGFSLIPFSVTAVLTAGASLAPLWTTASEWSLGGLLDLSRALSVFVRSVFIRTPVVYTNLGPLNLKVQGAPLTLSVLEAMPLVGGLTGAAVVGYQKYRKGSRPDLSSSPERTVDLLVVTYAMFLIIIYFPSLPVESSVTMRKIHPLYPLGIYALTRLEFVREAVKQRSVLVQAYLLVLGVGLIAFLLLAGTVTTGPHDAARINAIGSLVASAVLGYFTVVSLITTENQARSTAFGIGLAAASTTLFYLLSAFVYFPAPRYAIPVAKIIQTALSVW